MKDFFTTFTVPASPETVFNAINNVRGWWSENIEGNTAALHDIFHYRFKEVHHCTIQLTELIPGEKITWLVKDNHFNFTNNQQEWLNNRMHFTITGNTQSSTVHFIQEGLNPENECYDICSDCWTDYLHNSLRNFILTGKGNPNPQE